MTTAYDNARKWIQVVEAMMEHPFSPDDKTIHVAWQLQYTDAIARMNKCGLAVQSVLKNKISLLTAEAELNKAMENKFRKGLHKELKV
jgi:hypothetical protein